MAATRFDSISRLFARRKVANRVSQEATPAVAWDGEKVPYLFVQSFHGGSIAPKPGEDGTYTLTLEAGLGQTIYFSDRPERVVGTSPTLEFLAGLGFSEDNPPNAALVVDDGAGTTNIAVLELLNPTYHEATHTATYEVKTLEAWENSLDLGFSAAPADLSSLPASFGPAHLFVDDCPNGTVYCQTAARGIIAGFDNQGFCWNYSLCIPCEPYGHTQPDRCSVINYWTQKCNEHFDICNDVCTATFDNAAALCPS